MKKFLKCLWKWLLKPILILLMIFFSTWAFLNMFVPTLKEGVPFIDTFVKMAQGWWDGLRHLFGVA